MHQWRFRNNGAVFRDEDWNRLKKIGTRVYYVAYASTLNPFAAEGNPDEQKIGAFGVGKQRRVIFEHVEMLIQADRILQVGIRLEVDSKVY